MAGAIVVPVKHGMTQFKIKGQFVMSGMLLVA